MTPTIIMQDGLAIYRLGAGEPLLLFPYPHGSTRRPMAEDKLAGLLASMGRSVITFDPPGAYRSTRVMRCDMAEMVACAAEALAACQAASPVDVVGHSMGSLCALALAIEHPARVRRLVLVGSVSGWPAVKRWSAPHNWRPWRDVAWWQCVWWGARQIVGMGNLAVHKSLDNLVETASYVDKRHAELWIIEPGDGERPPPPRAQWLRAVRWVDFSRLLDRVQAPTLVLAGRHDPQTPVVCAEELANGIRDSRLVVFDHSGHAPFIEEPQHFQSEVAAFLEDRWSTQPDHRHSSGS